LCRQKFSVTVVHLVVQGQLKGVEEGDGGGQGLRELEDGERRR
jgi:hypothetical protein